MSKVKETVFDNYRSNMKHYCWCRHLDRLLLITKWQYEGRRNYKDEIEAVKWNMEYLKK